MSETIGLVPAALRGALADRYRVEREVGRGGMATVFLAHDLRHDRAVAIKVLHQDVATSLGADRFLREIAIAAKLQHPHILPLLDSGAGEGAAFLFYVMPFVPGESLRDKLARERELPIADAVRILREVADALAYAHDAGVVHRDIKPENVMLSGRHAFVMDFGVAKAVNDATQLGTLTAVGVTLGTPTYMAPEQAAADPLVDHRADLYAFGVMAYELLAGAPPFGGATAQAILAAHLTQEPIPLTAQRVVPPALAQLIMKCLEKRPADRWQSAHELAPLFDAVLAHTDDRGTARVLKPASVVGRGKRWLAVAGVAAVAVGIFVWSARRATQRSSTGLVAVPPAVAVLPFENVGGDSANEAYADGIGDDVRVALGKIGLRAAARSSSYAFKGQRADPVDVGRKLRVASYLTGTFRRVGNDLKVTAELVSVADGTAIWADTYVGSVRDIFRVQDSIATAVAGAMKVTLGAGRRTGLGTVGTSDLEAHDLLQQAVFFHNKYTQRDLVHAIALYERASARDPRYVAPYVGLGQAWINLADDWLPPREAYPKAKVAIAHALALDDGDLAALAARGLARVLYDWDLEGAERDYRRALAIDSSEAAVSEAGAHGFVLTSRGQWDAAITFKARAANVDPLFLIKRWDLARTLVDANRLDSAEAVTRSMREVDAHYTWLPVAIGMLRVRQGRFSQALDELRAGDTTLNQVAGLMAEAEAGLGRRDDAFRRVRALETARRRGYVDGTIIA
ncbi:MAG: protein kinase, partial [Gemmatimonadales bacterium]